MACSCPAIDDCTDQQLLRHSGYLCSGRWACDCGFERGPSSLGAWRFGGWDRGFSAEMAAKTGAITSEQRP